MSRILHITSPRNEVYRSLLQLTDRKGISRQKCALLSGPKFVREMLLSRDKFVELVIANEEQHQNEIATKLYQNFDVVLLSAPLFRELDVYGTDFPLLKVKFRTMEEMPLRLDAQARLSVLLPFQHPDNIGAALRSCSAFAVERIILSKEAAHPFHPKSLRVSGPSVFDLDIRTTGFFADIDSDPDLNVYVFDASGIPLPDLKMKTPTLVVCGLEGPGVGQAFPKATRVAIPMRAGVESLNAAQTLNIALYHHYTQKS